MTMQKSTSDSVILPLAAAGLLWLLQMSLVQPVYAAKPVKVLKESRRVETRQIESMEEQWRNAVVKGDSSLLEKLLSDDFLAISARGTLSDKQQYMGRIASHTTQFSAFQLMDLKITVHQGSAVAVSQAHIAGVLEGKPIEGVFRYTKVYGRSAGGAWRMTNFEATRVSAASTGEMDSGSPLREQETKK